MIVTERLILSPTSVTDFDDCHAARTDPEVMHFIGGPATSEDTWIKLLRNIGHWSAFGHGLFTVREKHGGRFVGDVGLATFHRDLGEDFDPYPEAAWVLARSAHGKGYATEAVQAAHDWYFARREPGRTVCIIAPENQPSVRVAERLGYRAFGDATYKGKTVTKFERLA
ncbi:MAG TPA: GNAT family N-acetyltransferase [Luteibacter sp.]|uniref:GNAT family N-acetyltransferase n=1 Tax=Luteibacter sp. TaxID=1886636 RepID=UPI002C373430|nr:GNAT family N-acetyltransferase [Luteibacter sp.]HVI53899.1 GNAT family N-acetyltransferase [Luteibacter sp.]